MNIIDVFKKAENKDKATYAVINHRSFTYQQFLLEIKKIAVLLDEKGIKKGDRIILSVADDYDTMLFFIAALRMGIATVLIDSTVKKERAQSIIAASTPAGYIVTESLVDDWQIDKTKTVISCKKRDSQEKETFFERLFGKNGPKNSTAEDQYYPGILNNIDPQKAKLPDTIDENAIAYIIYTSGTTSDNKGVIITHKNLFTHLDTLTKVYGLTKNSRILNILNLYHADGMIQGPVLALYTQSEWYRPFKFDISQIGQLYHSIYRLRITHFFAAPAMLSIMEKFSEGYTDSFQTADFRCIVSVSSHLEEPLWKRFSDKFNVRIVNVYGLTETVAGSIFCGPEDDIFKMGTIGKPVDCEAKIIDNDGKEVLPGQHGELLLKGDHVMSGYLNNEAATKSALKENWLYTGDIAVCDEEGFYRITGRKKNLIISGGFNIHPEEVTEILNMHSDVMESVSFGISDEVFGEKLVSCVVLKEDSAANENMLTNHCRQNLEPEKVPHQIQVMSSLPKGISGKVKLEEVKRLFFSTDVISMDETDTILETIMDAASNTFRVPRNEIKPESTSATVSGWDSLPHLMFITALEDKFKIRMNPAEIMTANSISGIEKIVKNKLR